MCVIESLGRAQKRIYRGFQGFKSNRRGRTFEVNWKVLFFLKHFLHWLRSFYSYLMQLIITCEEEVGIGNIETRGKEELFVWIINEWKRNVYTILWTLGFACYTFHTRMEQQCHMMLLFWLFKNSFFSGDWYT